MDLISREEVHRVLAFYIYELATDALTVDEFRAKIRECIDGIPSQNKWISVKDRLPEEGCAVLVWCPERKNTYCAYLEERQWWIFGAYFEKVKLEIIAWMPLPEPYKGEK